MCGWPDCEASTEIELILCAQEPTISHVLSITLILGLPIPSLQRHPFQAGASFLGIEGIGRSTMWKINIDSQ